MIEVKKITKEFGEKVALSDLSFTVRNGKAFGLLGRNGAGKTTCMRIIMNIFKADSGEILIDGEPSYKEVFKIGYLPEERGLYPNRKIIDQMVYIGELRGMNRNEAKKNSIAKLEELEADEYVDKNLSTLSKGNQQKIQLAIALLNDPEIIILDEPFSGLDPVNAQLLKDIVRRQVDMKKTVIFSSHQMSQVEEFCDDICLINEGKNVLNGNLDEIKKSYPRNIVGIEIAKDKRNDFADRLSGSFKAKSIKDTGKSFEVTLHRPEEKDALFSSLTEIGFIPERFEVKEPTLEQIFVEKVGGNRE